MKTEASKVKHKSEVVAEIDIPIYENIEELLAAVGGDVIVEKFNKANKIDLQAAARSPFSEKKAGKQKRAALGFDLLTTDEIMKYVGNHAGLMLFMESPEMQIRIDAKIAETTDPAPTTDPEATEPEDD